MPTTLDDWKALLAPLPDADRAELAAFLLASLPAEPNDPTAEAAWDALASSRVADIRAGTAKGRDAASYLAELRERYP